MPTLFDEIEAREAEPVELPPVPGSLADRMPPRDYQAEAVGNFLLGYANGERHFMYRMATGLGKTYSAALTIENWLAMDPRNRALVIAYERGLVQQFRDEIEEFLPSVTVGLEMGDDGTVHPKRLPRITCASRQSLYLAPDDSSRLFKFDAMKYNWLVTCDEAHGYKASMPSFTHIVDWFERNPQSAWLGLTATPERGDGVSLARLFGHNCCEMRLSTAINEGYLVPLKQKFISVEGVDFKNLREVAGDFDDGELDKILSEREQLLAMAVPLLETVGIRRTLVFTPGVNCAKALAATITAEIKERGLPHGHAEYMVGATPEDERQRIINGHQSGKFQFLVVCGLCRAGYNDPSLEAVAVFRPTKSKVMAEQMKGRGVRTLKGVINGLTSPEERKAAIESSAKDSCLVVDLVGVSGMPEVASTAHLLASGEDDVVIERANQRLAESGNDESVEEAIGKAKSQIAEEREAARVAAEERKRAERAEYERRAKLRGNVRYDARDVAGIGHGSARIEGHGHVGGAGPTDKQIWYLVNRCGWREASARRISKGQASAVISKHKAGGETSATHEASGGIDWSGPPTAKQVAALQRHAKHVPRTAKEASEILSTITWGPKATA